MTLPWNLQLGQCHILSHCNHCLRSDEIRCYHFCLGTRYLELHSITRSGVVHCIRSPDNMNFPPHTTSPPPINGIKYQSFLHNYSSTDTSWVRHPIQVSPSSFHTYVPQMNTFKVPCWHCKYEFDIHSIFPRTTGNPVVDTIHDSKMNITDKHFLKWIRTNTFDHLHSQSEQVLRIKLLQNYWVTLTLPSVMTVLASSRTPPRQYSSFTSPMPSRRHLAHHSSRFSLWQTFHLEECFISPVCRSD